MLRNVILFSGFVIFLACLPLVVGPISVPSSTPKEAPTDPTSEVNVAEKTVLARVETTDSRRTETLKRDRSGHYMADLRMNGQRVKGMIDTGATVIAINRATARLAGVTLSQSDFTAQVSTANGVVGAAPIVIKTIDLGRIRLHDVQAVVLEDQALSGTLIGMSFLNRLSKVEVRGDTLVLAE